MWQPSTPLIPQGCNVTGNFAFIAHGYQGSKSTWIAQLVEKLLVHRGGCVISINWGRFSDITDYSKIVRDHFTKASAVVVKKLRQLESEGVSSDNIYMYGHSLGARMVIEAGLRFGERRIGLIDGECKSSTLNDFSILLKKNFLATLHSL